MQTSSETKCDNLLKKKKSKQKMILKGITLMYDLYQTQGVIIVLLILFSSVNITQGYDAKCFKWDFYVLRC